MSQLKITEKSANTSNILYVKSGLEELFERTGCQVSVGTTGQRNLFKISCPECYEEIIRSELLTKVSEVIAIKYKYDYFKTAIKIAGLCELEKEILLASLIAADLDDDKNYVYDKIKNETEVAVDGTYNFRLSPLKKKWEDIVSYMPSCFLSSQLNDFVSFLLENKKKRAFIDNGKVYDEHYRRLNRSKLIEYPKGQIVREIILSNSREVEVSGELDFDDEKYLREFYGDKIYFSNNLLS